MALYEKMVLISEQEYLQLKGFQMHVGERHDGDIDYGAGDGDDGDGGDDGGDDGGGDEGGAEQRQRLNEQYRAMFQRARERRNVNEPLPPPQRLNEQYADFRHRMRQHLLRYRQDKHVAALPPRTIQRTPLPATSPQLSPAQAAVATLHRLTPSQTAAATRQGLLHPTVFQSPDSPPVYHSQTFFGSPPIRPQTPFGSPPSEYGSFHPPSTIKTISPRNRPPVQTPEFHFERTPTYGGAARRIQFAADSPIAHSSAARRIPTPAARRDDDVYSSLSDIELFEDTPRQREASTTLHNIQLAPEDLGMLAEIGVPQPISTMMALWEPAEQYRDVTEPMIQNEEEQLRDTLIEEAVAEIPADASEEDRRMAQANIEEAVEDVIAENVVDFPAVQGDDQPEQAQVREYAIRQRQEERLRERFMAKNRARQGYPPNEPLDEIQMILPPIIVEQMPQQHYDQLNNTIGRLNPETLAQITRIAEAEMVHTYQAEGLPPPAILPAVDVVIIDDDDDVAIIDDDDDDIRPDDFDQDFLLNIRGKAYENHRADAGLLQSALVQAGLLVKGGLITGGRTLLRFQMVPVLRYLTNNNNRLDPPDKFFNANDENYTAVNIIIENARGNHPQLMRLFGTGIKRILRREITPHQLGRAEWGLCGRPKKSPPKRKGGPIMSRLMQEVPSPPRVVAKRKLTPILKQAKIVLERVTKKKTPPPKAAKLPAHLRRDYNVDLDASPGPSTSQRPPLAPRDPWHTVQLPRGPTPPARPPWNAAFLKELEE